MKTINKYIALVGATTLLATPNLFASIGTGTATVTAPGYPPDVHGPYKVVTTQATGPDLGTFYTFCLAEPVTFDIGATYSYEIDTVVQPPSSGTYFNYVSCGTAWLWDSWRQGSIGSGNTVNDPLNDAVQEAIWYLQDNGNTITGGSQADTYVQAAITACGGTLADAQQPNVGGDAYAFNLYTTDKSGRVYAQPLLAVPEPSTVVAGALLLLPFGVSTLRILRKKQQS
jgi:hypothetical protein